MGSTPLQIVLGLSHLGHEARVTAELLIALLFGTGALAMRGRKRALRAPSLVMCALGLLLDAAATPRFALWPQWTRWASALGLVLVCWGIIKAVLDAADVAAHHSRAHFSTIFKELLMLLLFAVSAMTILAEQARVDPVPLLASSAVVGVVLGFALQESLGNIFSGLALQLGRPFAPGDWVRTSNYSGRVQGINWRSTALITRSNERLDIPNSMLAKDAVVNYSNGLVSDEVSLGLSYDAPPNYAREAIAETLRGIPGVLENPPPDIFAWDYGDFAVRYRVKYWMADYAVAEHLRDLVVTSLWYALRRKAIEIPYPVRTLRAEREETVNRGAEAFEREIIAELRQVDFLQDLVEEELRLLLPGVTVLKFGNGETIVREGDEGDSLYIIRSGTVEVMASANGRKEVHVNDLRHPAFFGEIALMTGEPRNATIRARSDAELLQLNREGFVRLFSLHPETAARMGEIIARRLSERRELLAAAPHGENSHSHANWLFSKISSVFNLSPAR